MLLVIMNVEKDARMENVSKQGHVTVRLGITRIYAVLSAAINVMEVAESMTEIATNV